MKTILFMILGPLLLLLSIVIDQMVYMFNMWTEPKTDMINSQNPFGSKYSDEDKHALEIFLSTVYKEIKTVYNESANNKGPSGKPLVNVYGRYQID